jgi:hypothetical protein
MHHDIHINEVTRRMKENYKQICKIVEGAQAQAIVDQLKQGDKDNKRYEEVLKFKEIFIKRM